MTTHERERDRDRDRDRGERERDRERERENPPAFAQEPETRDSNTSTIDTNNDAAVVQRRSPAR